MNVLILGVMDCSGSGVALANAINSCTGHEARAVFMRRTRYRYPSDVLKPSPDELLTLIEWCDVLNLQVRGEEIVPDGAPRRPTVKTYHGTEYRWRWKKENAKARRAGWTQHCMTIDLSIHGATWIGRAQPVIYRNPVHDGFHIVHAAAPDRKHKADRKGTSLVEAALSQINGITYDVFREVHNRECLRRKARADLYVDQVGPRALGYGTNAVEAWALGLPVIASAPVKTLAMMRTTFGGLPFLVCPRDANEGTIVGFLRDQIWRLANDPRYRDKLAGRGLQHWARWHSPRSVARRSIALFEEAVCRFSS